MVRQWSAAAIAACVFIGGCTSGTGTPPPAGDDAAPDPRRPTVYDDQLEALDKAKAVQATLDKAGADRRKALDDSGG